MAPPPLVFVLRWLRVMEGVRPHRPTDDAATYPPPARRLAYRMNEVAADPAVRATTRVSLRPPVGAAHEVEAVPDLLAVELAADAAVLRAAHVIDQAMHGELDPQGIELHAVVQRVAAQPLRELPGGIAMPSILPPQPCADRHRAPAQPEP